MRDTIVNQRTWRAIGLVTLGISCVMAWYGVQPGVTGQALPLIAAYWGFFLLALLITLYMVLLDLRYIRLQYLQDERQLFQETIGSEEFRQAIRPRRDARPPDQQGDSDPSC